MDLNKIVDSYKEEIIKSAQGLIAIRSVEEDPLPGKPFGEGTDQALQYALTLASELGFEVKNVEGYAGHAEFGEGSETLGILAHLDVVPEGDNWTYPPYGGEIHDGKIYGRGAIDDKGPAIGALYAMKAVKDSGLKLGRKVRIIFGLDEESGWEDMKVYFARESMPDISITPDGDYPVIHAEKGIMNVSIQGKFPSEDCVSACIGTLEGGLRPNMVPDVCTCSFEPAGDSDKILTHLHSFNIFTGFDLKAEVLEDGVTLVTAHGVSAHGSTPEQGENAIRRLLAFLSTLGLGSSEMEKFILLLNDRLGTDTTGEAMNIAFKDDVSGALTLNLGTISLNQETAQAVINIRYPVTCQLEWLEEQIKMAFAEPGVTVEIKDHMAPLYVPKDHFLIQTLLKVYSEQTGLQAEALSIGGGTYARAVKNGAAFGANFPGRPELAHQRDEYMSVDDLILHTKIYAHAIAALCGDC